MNKVIRKIKEGFFQKAFRELCWIYRLLSQYRGRIALYTAMNILAVGLSLFLTMQTQSVVDGIVGQNWSLVKSVALLYLGVGMCNIALNMANQRVSGRISARVKTELAEKAYDSILHADWETVILHHSGDLMTRMQEDITTVAGSTVGWIPTLISQGIQCVFALGLIVFYDASMLGMVILVVPIVLFGSRVFLGKMYAANTRQRTVSSELMSNYKESFQHLQSIKSFNLLDRFQQRMCRQQDEREKVDLDVNKYSVASWAVMYISGQLAALACLAWALYHVYRGVLSLGSMALLMMMAIVVAGNFKTVIQLIPTAVNTLASSERIRSILELPEERLENEAAYDEMKAHSENGVSIVLKDMDFAYRNGCQVFENVSCRVNAGEIVAFVGPSGEGKTTLLRILLGIIRAQGGVTLESESGTLPVTIASRKLMAYVPQGNTMLNGTIADNLRMLKPNATDEELVAALKEACAYEFVEKLPDGIYHNIGESGIGFSEGQNQRLAIARALMCKTPLLLLDEATSALDVATERRVLTNLMQSVHRRTCILTTHRPSVLSMCDRVYRIADKKVKEVGENEIQQIMNDF